MLKKTQVRFFALMLILTVALVTSCTNSNQGAGAALPEGSTTNPQTGMKKQSGGT
jgi:hypothetical protein